MWREYQHIAGVIELPNETNQKLDELRQRRDEARLGGGLKKQEAIRKSGRGTARDRISMLLDEESFIEIDSFVTHRTVDHNMFLHQTLGDGVVAGHGTIDGRRVYCFAQYFSVHSCAPAMCVCVEPLLLSREPRARTPTRLARARWSPSSYYELAGVLADGLQRRARRRAQT